MSDRPACAKVQRTKRNNLNWIHPLPVVLSRQTFNSPSYIFPDCSFFKAREMSSLPLSICSRCREQSAARMVIIIRDQAQPFLDTHHKAPWPSYAPQWNKRLFYSYRYYRHYYLTVSYMSNVFCSLSSSPLYSSILLPLPLNPFLFPTRPSPICMALSCCSFSCVTHWDWLGLLSWAWTRVYLLKHG